MRWLFCFLFLLGCTREPEKNNERPKASVTLAEAKCETRPYLIQTIGNLEAYASVDIRPQVTGELTGYYFKDGALIKKGDLLFTIDPKPYMAKLEEALGQLGAAKASFTFNQAKVEKYKGLLPEEYVSKLDYQEYFSNALIAESQVREYEGSVKNAKINLGYCTINSPIDGLLGRHLKDPGNLVTANQEEALVTIKQLKPIYAYFTLAERFLRQLQDFDTQGLEVTVNVIDQKRTQKGVLDFINNTVDSSTGTIRLRGIFDNEELTLWPGQFVDVAIKLYDIENAIVVPEMAVNLDSQGPFIYVAKGDFTVEKRIVTLGQLQGDDRIIEEGIHCGEKVVIEGQLGLFSGASYTLSNSGS